MKSVSKKLVKFDQDNSKLVALPNEPKPQAVTAKTLKDPAFPVDVFPKQFQELIKELVEKQGLNLDWCCTSALGYLASAVGAKARLRVSGEWIAPCCLYICIIGDSGLRKTPVLKFFSKPIQEIEDEYQHAYELDLKKYRAAKQEAQNAKIPFGDELPRRKNFKIQSATTESIDSELCSGDNSILVDRDELVGLLKSLNQYRQGDDQEKFLTYFEGDGVKINRASAEVKYTRFSNVCIVGGTQPSKLGEFSGRGRDADGTVYRFLFSYPEGIKKQHLKEGRVIIENEGYYKDIFERLHNLSFALDKRGQPTPHILEWCDDARSLFKKWYDSNADLFNSSQVIQERSIMSKIEGVLPRLALVLELMQRATDLPDNAQSIDLKKVCVSVNSFNGAKRLVDYFFAMALKVQGSIHNMEDTSSQKYPSGIKWSSLFTDEDMCLKAKDIKKWVMDNYPCSSRKADDLLKELTFVSYGVYKI